MTGRSTRHSFDWLRDPAIRSVAITGICKNAGKTTLLNHLLTLDGDAPQGVFSTGIDGEEADTVFRTPKPRVKLPAGSLFCCDTDTLDRHASDVSVLGKLPFSEALRPLWLARAETAVETEITGPASVREQIKLLKLMLGQDVRRVLIDGSLDRKSIALSEDVDAIALLLGASFGTPSTVANELRRLLLLNGLPASLPPAMEAGERSDLLDSEFLQYFVEGKWHPTELDTLIGEEKQLKEFLALNPRRIFIPGALTDSIFARVRTMLQDSGTELIFRHPDCLKLSLPKLESLLDLHRPTVLIPFKIKSFVLNTQAIGAPAVDADLFRSRLRSEFPNLDLPDIRELRS